MSSQEVKDVEEKSFDLGKFRRILFILFGDLLCAMAVNLFFVPNRLLSGGVGGISILIQYLTDIPAGIMMFIINIPIFIYGFKRVDKDFALYGFISMVSLSTLLTLTRGLSETIYVDDILLAAVFGGVINGVGMGLLFRNRSSQGGFDIIAVSLKKKFNMNIGSALMGFNFIIITLSSLIFGYKKAMYTLISMYIAYNVVDQMQMGFNRRKNVIIISEKSEEISMEIIKRLHRGVTFLEGRGAYTKEDKEVIYCIVTSRQVAVLKDIVESIDPKAFLTINDVVEVMGRGFKNSGI